MLGTVLPKRQGTSWLQVQTFTAGECGQDGSREGSKGYWVQEVEARVDARLQANDPA